VAAVRFAMLLGRIRNLRLNIWNLGLSISSAIVGEKLAVEALTGRDGHLLPVGLKRRLATLLPRSSSFAVCAVGSSRHEKPNASSNGGMRRGFPDGCRVLYLPSGARRAVAAPRTGPDATTAHGTRPRIPSRNLARKSRGARV
jgi:hypothetical protein